MKRVETYEVSPVLRGAGVNTECISIKNLGVPYNDEAQAVLAAVKGFVVRTKSLADLRRKEGRMMSEPNMERMMDCMAEMEKLCSEMREMMGDMEPAKSKAQKLFLDYLKIQNDLMEVTR